MNYPNFAEINGKKYKINTDFRVAIECSEIAMDTTIGDYERTLAIIYKLFGDEGLDAKKDYEELLKMAKKFLGCGKEVKNNKIIEPDMDFTEDMDYIEASFMSDYNIDLTNIEMHWWKFSNLINGLSNSELGNCCVLNRVRNLRTYDTSKIKDQKELAKINEAKKQVALKRKSQKPSNLTEEQQRNIENYLKMAGIKREE